ncbi:MAG: aldehyde dehydrogenase family protein [Candidatus Tectomicrobia bacterium]|uniref:Aldehyde dehydrogenase family protein n=1 Tax=Tectimicrobiota bacterium TaxID=2528274 RepID=A0A932MM24_UNCTE|nr:aldehyde dehydrogenase family protein [Candidatus Tectomicrobia bacterium]
MEGRNLIGGEWVSAAGGAAFESVNPARTDEVIGRFPRSGAKDAERAVAAAKEAFPGWRALSRIRRGEFFDAFVQLVKAEQEPLADLLARECGKPRNEALADVVEGIHMAQYVFGASRMPLGEVLASEFAAKDSSVVRKPKGVMAVITPWNFPFAIPLWLLGPSLVEGNTAVFKPSEDTPAVGHRLAELMREAGFPDGVVNLLQGTGEEAGDPLIRHKDVEAVLFTGSFEVGQLIRKACAESEHRLAVCEMGGKNALIVLKDARMDLAVRAGLLSAFKTAGQRCVSAGRILIEEPLYEEYCRRFAGLAARIRVGDPLDPAMFMGPLINEAAVQKVTGYNKLAREEGGEILLDRAELPDGERRGGHFMGPFVYKLAPSPKSRVLREEVFGPHVALVPVRDLDHAIEVYNDTPYGLACAVATEDYRKARRIQRECEFGLGYVNLPTIGAEVHLPFGGVKRSGTGMPSAAALFAAVTHQVAWTVNHAEEIELAQGLSSKVD